jgi:hypothetical protein
VPQHEFAPMSAGRSSVRASLARFDVTLPVYLKDDAFRHKLSVVRLYQPHQIIGIWNLLNR